MPDREKSNPPPPLTDWTDHGVFRAAFLERFDPKDRPVFRQAGKVLAVQVISGDVHHEPVVLSELEAAYRDAVALADYLREVWNKGEDVFPTERQQRLAERAHEWAGEVAVVALAIRGALDAEGES